MIADTRTREHANTKTTRNFEDLLIWQFGQKLVLIVYASSEQWKDWGLKDQIRRAVVSVVSNIAEGFERGSRVDFMRFLYISRGSVGEVRAQLYIARDLHYINSEQFKVAFDLADHVSRMIGKFISRNRKDQSRVRV